jgi:hypothetical protein
MGTVMFEYVINLISLSAKLIEGLIEKLKNLDQLSFNSRFAFPKKILSFSA